MQEPARASSTICSPPPEPSTASPEEAIFDYNKLRRIPNQIAKGNYVEDLREGGEDPHRHRPRVC